MKIYRRTANPKINKSHLKKFLFLVALYFLTSYIIESTDPQVKFEENDKIVAQKLQIVHPHPPFTSLIKSLIIQTKNSNLLVVVTANYAHLKLLLNWIEGFHRCFGKDYNNKFIVIALDNDLYKAMSKINIPTILVNDLVPSALIPHFDSQVFFATPSFRYDP
jgi:hypothetical protein